MRRKYPHFNGVIVKLGTTFEILTAVSCGCNFLYLNWTFKVERYSNVMLVALSHLTFLLLPFIQKSTRIDLFCVTYDSTTICSAQCKSNFLRASI